jgi:hypothetical protein
LRAVIDTTPHWIACADRVPFILKMLTNQKKISVIWISPQETFFGLVSKKKLTDVLLVLKKSISFGADI